MMDFRDEIYFLVLTVIMEAGGEPFDGKVGVGYTIMNRGGSVTDTVFRAYQFSAWNTDSPTRMNLDIIPDIILMESYKAAVAAYFKLLPDPTNGATHYLNEEVTKKIRGGTLPGWFDESKVTARIGKHTFLKLG
jgi:spore germination cell wall hydrolase CwlJ-like protein